MSCHNCWVPPNSINRCYNVSVERLKPINIGFNDIFVLNNSSLPATDITVTVTVLSGDLIDEGEFVMNGNTGIWYIPILQPGQEAFSFLGFQDENYSFVVNVTTPKCNDGIKSITVTSQPT